MQKPIKWYSLKQPQCTRANFHLKNEIMIWIEVEKIPTFEPSTKNQTRLDSNQWKNKPKINQNQLSMNANECN